MSKGLQYCDPPKGYKGNYQWMNFKGKRRMVGAGRSPFFSNLIERIRRDKESLVIVVTARQGKGKSWFALRLAEEIDDKFDPEIQVVFDQKSMLKLISETSPLKRGRVILVDEAQMSLGARNWQEQMQKDLMTQMQAVRSKGLIIIVVTLGIDIIDVVMRKYIINYMAFMEKRGKASVYEIIVDRFTGKDYPKKLGTVYKKAPGYEKCQCLEPTCLVCPNSGIVASKWSKREKWKEIGFKPCMNIRAVYERKKKLYVELNNEEALVKAETAELKKKPLDKKGMCEYLLGLPTPIKLNSKGNWNDADMKVALSVGFKGQIIGRDTLNELKTMARAEKPEIFKK